MKRKESLAAIRFNEPATIFAIRHTMKNSSSCYSNHSNIEAQRGAAAATAAALYV